MAHDGEPPTLILDAGTGLRSIGKLLDGQPFRGTLILSHLHWDHMMGLPFFGAGDHPDAEVTLLVPEQGESAEALLGRAMSPPMFPITPAQLRGTWTFDTYSPGKFDLGGFSVLAREIPHKGGVTMGLRVATDSGSMAYLPDHAPHQLGRGESGVGEFHDAACELASGVDVLLHDAQYTRDELEIRFDWGHAAVDYAVLLAERCQAKRVLLFHHDPSRTDPEVERLRASVAAMVRIPVDTAVEGAVVDI